MRVRIAFDLASQGQGAFFTLDDPVKGVLDNTTYTLVGDVLIDVTDDVRSVQVKRGRSRTLEKFTAGAANLILDNRDRTWDPANAAGPYFGLLVPRKQVIVDINGQRLFTGTVEDWNLSYSLSGDATAEPSCTDGFAVITGQNLTPGTATAQGAGARVTAVLDDIGWPDGLRAISTGDSTLAADVIGDSQDALAYLQKVELGEAGALFIDAGGAVAFRSRSDLEAFRHSVVFGPDGIPFSDIATDYGRETMVNQATVTYPGGTAISSDTAAIEAYGLMPQSFDTLLADGTQAMDFADWQVSTYAQPRLRITGIDLVLDGLTSEQRAAVLALELGDVTRVTWTPNDVGDPISQYATVDGIAHNATPRTHTMSLTLSQTFLGFLLDSPTLGILDTSTLGL